MAGRIPESVLRQIEQRLSLVDIVSDHLALKKQGRNYVGLCPFHHEKTPSFTVSPEKGLFYCFGCGAGGGLVQFVMRMENTDFVGAVRQLARRAGVSIEAWAPRSEDSRAKELLAAASEFFASCLRSHPSGAEGRKYLEVRALSSETVERFRLGYCPPGNEFATFLQQRGFSFAEATRVGLLVPGASAGRHARFGRRLIFPIRDLVGEVVGFGARAIRPEHQPKYLNSPESAWFRKSEVLYGLFEARHAIRDHDRVVVVEGYMDALQLVQAGIPNVVATMGTAWTVAHARLVRRFVRECIVLFDGDEAGRRAAERAFWICAEAGLWPLGVFLPSGTDPDSFVRSQGTEAMRRLLDDARPLLDFCLQRLIPPSGRVAERLAAAERLRVALDRVTDPALAAEITRVASVALRLPEEVVRGPKRREARLARSVIPVAERADPWRTPVEERTLLEVVALDPEVAAWVASQNLWTCFRNRDLARVARSVAEAWERGAPAEEVYGLLPPAVQPGIAKTQMGLGEFSGADLHAVARDCVKRLLERQRRARLRELREQLRSAESGGDAQLVARLRQELKRLDELRGEEG